MSLSRAFLGRRPGQFKPKAPSAAQPAPPAARAHIELRRESHLVQTDVAMEGRHKEKRRVQGQGPTDRRLRSATKRQKVEVGESCSGAAREESVPEPRPPPKTSPRNAEMDPVEAVDDAPERGAAREPPVNSDHLPLPWTGRLGYACLNTYLRTAKPPVFCSRTCRIASILEHRHPLQDPSLPEHPTKNRPDASQPADLARGQRFVQGLGLANARDMVKMLRWNDKYGIRFMRLSSDMFPFASHPEHGYALAPFAAGVLAEAGRVAAELGHRLTTHPGQFTQLGSPRPDVIAASVRDLEYHAELLSLLRLPPQQDRDAVMVLHMGGLFGDKAATLARFRANLALLRPAVRARLVLENDDVGWSVHDLLPVCEALDLPLVLDWHHHNIVFDASAVREGTADLAAGTALAARIAATWSRRGITQKMHYSEARAGAVTPRDRRKHSARVATLPPCAPGVDLMVEAKDKEQAVFELMRAFRLPAFARFHDMVPHERDDDHSRAGGKKKAGVPATAVSADEFGMGGPRNRVYWPPGMDAWLKPKKRERAVKEGEVAVAADDQGEDNEGEEGEGW